MSTFRIAAIETHEAQAESNSAKMYKVLKPNKVYYLLDGYQVEKGQLIRSEEPLALYGDKIEVSAVVGANGSGKSSLIELMIRAVNNFACYLIGEFRVGSAAEHLHYIEHVRATIYFDKGGVVGKLHVHDREVVLTYGKLKIELSKLNPAQSPKNKHIKDQNQQIVNTDGFQIIRNLEPTIEIKGTEKSRNEILSELFYTIVNNYSIYAYNTCDFVNENTIKRKAEYIYYKAKQEFGSGEIKADDYNWLKGVFFRNDGYTTPVVLTPMRIEGNISINKENDFAKSRLLSMLLYKNETSSEDPYPFRKINKTKKVVGIVLGSPKEKYSTKKTYHSILASLLQTSTSNISTLVDSISAVYQEVFGLDYSKRNKYFKAAQNYLIYKMIRISLNYEQFKDFHSELKSILEQKGPDAATKQSVDKITKAYILKLIQNPSHITQKWRQALALLRFKFYKPGVFPLDKIEEFVKTSKNTPMLVYPDKGNGGSFISRPPIWEETDLLPPSFLNPEVQILDTAEKKPIPFHTLSSGERQMIYFVYGFAYHLININSAYGDKSGRVKYKYVFSVFEEIELYFHPDMQRLLIKRLVDAINSMDLKYIEGIHLLFVTHSPFILSDIPSKACLLLNEHGEPLDADKKKSVKTFGANLFDILRSSFFLNKGVIGAFAEEKIREILQTDDYKTALDVAELIDDPYVQSYVKELIYNAQPEELDTRIAVLEQEAQRLRKIKDTQGGAKR